MDIFKYRYELLKNINEDTYGVDKALRYYKNNPIDFINDWGITYDPRLDKKLVPFKLWKKQADYIEWLESRYKNKETGIVEKSRDSGMTWLTIAWAIHKWLFVENFSAGFGSRKEMLVDRLGDSTSIFGKGRMFIDYLPEFFLPKGFDTKKHLTYLKFINPENGSTIIGEAGDNIGRGGRTSFYFVDEASFIKRAELIDASLSANTEVRIDGGTPNGTGNPFYDKVVSGKFNIFRFHWSEDPRKSKEWAEKKRREIGDVHFAKEYDIDYSNSIANLVISDSWIRSAIELDVDISGKIIAGLDVADDGMDKNCIYIRKGSRMLYLEEWNGIDTTQTTYKALEICKDFKVDEMYYDSIGVGAGVRGAINSIKRDLKIKVVGINVGSSTSNKRYNSKEAKDLFINLKAELWWNIRDKFINTHSYVSGDKKADTNNLISILDEPQLIRELSQPLYFFNENGKIQIEKKIDMAKRGIKSPNKADALILSYANTVKPNYASIY